MSRVLLTAFEPYGEWTENASWLTLVEVTKNLPDQPHVTTRRYPVDFAEARRRLERDLADDYDFAVHLGQAPRSACLQLEAVGMNVAGEPHQLPEQYQPIETHGPIAYRSTLPLAHWARQLRELGTPAQVSYHAGSYLCNALLYLTHHLAQNVPYRTQATFVHLPLDTTQVLHAGDLPSYPVAQSAAAVQQILRWLAEDDFGAAV